MKNERNVFGQLVLLAIQNDISMAKVLSYPLCPVPSALGTGEGCLAKTDKSKLMHSIVTNAHLVEFPSTQNIRYIIDGNALLQTQVNVPDTFGDLAECVFDQLPNVKRVVFCDRHIIADFIQEC